MAKAKITQIKSVIDRPEVQKRTIKALGLGKINRSKEVEMNPAMTGMVNRVKHLLTVENL